MESKADKPEESYELNVITVKAPTTDEICDEVSPSAVQNGLQDQAHNIPLSGMEKLKLEDGKSDNDSPETPSKRGVKFRDDFPANEDDPVKENVNCVTFNIKEPPSNLSTKSKSERDGDRHRKSESRLFPKKLGLRISQTRTITPSTRRSRNSTLLVQPGKGRHSLHHRITIEALCKNGANCDDGCGKDNDEENNRNGGGDSKDVKHLNIQLKGRTPAKADSVKFQRRGRSLFRSTMHKRSRARSPGQRHGEDTGKVRGIRRESPSPEPARRKRNWVRKVMTRAEREKKLKEKDEAGPKENHTA